MNILINLFHSGRIRSDEKTFQGNSERCARFQSEEHRPGNKTQKREYLTSAVYKGIKKNYLVYVVVVIIKKILVKIYSQDIGMEFRIEKCAIMKKG